MYKNNVDTVKSPAVLSKIIKDFKSREIPRFNKLEKYYNTQNSILSRKQKKQKPNNKLAHGFAKYITTMATGYFMGKPVRFDIKDEALKSYITDILSYNYTDNFNFEIAKEASKKGISFEILYLDSKGRLKSGKFSAEEVIPIYSQKLGNFLECAIRLWEETDEREGKIEYAALYTETDILTYRKTPDAKAYVLIDESPHLLGDIPVIVYWNNEEQTGDYESVIPLIDAYDQAQSDTANENDYFTDAYLVISGASGGFQTPDGDIDDDTGNAIESMKENKVLLFDEKGQAEWLVKNINDTAIENYKKRIFSDMFFLSQVPALTDESFAGNLTGVAIKYKLVGLEQLSVMKENKFRAAIKKKLKIITDFINLKYNQRFNSDEIKIMFERNFIDNLTETIENAAKLEGITSKKTQFSLLPFIPDTEKELEQIDIEKDGFSIRNKSLDESVDDL